jgi:hypothetical protein
MILKPQKRVKCPGRFSGLRGHLHNEVVPVVLEDRTSITEENLEDMWTLIEGDVLVYDPLDPYYDSKTDTLRRLPNIGPLSLVPLFPSHFHFEDGLIQRYVQSMQNSESISQICSGMGDHPEKFFQSTLGRDPSSILIPNNGKKGKTNYIPLTGYIISGNFGLGSISPGGMQGGGVRSDSPFLLEVYKVEKGGEQNLAAVVGFWAQEGYCLISQLQPCKNAQLPNRVKFGVGALHIAETAAKAMGFKGVLLYSGKGHPMFKEHPSSWSQLGRDFVCIWDCSAKKLGYNGSRNSHYVKHFKNT